MVFRDYDPWAALLTIGELELSGGLVVLGVVLVAALFVERPWCRYACPLGAAIGIASKVSPLRLRRAGPACAGCALCNRDCPVGIPVDTRSDITDASCIMCLRCVDTCPKHGALELALVIPVVSPRPSGAEQSCPRRRSMRSSRCRPICRKRWRSGDIEPVVSAFSVTDLRAWLAARTAP
ncbi:MAG: 4Fe-4S binding protein [Kouleothrix sp.]|nr:4Fe-4S binding protein [Kouleothrix sp.]